MRTTLDIDDPVLADLKRLQKEQGKTLGRLVSDLLAEVLGQRTAPRKRPPFRWNASTGGLLIDPRDKEAIYAILDEESLGRRR